MDKTQLGPEGDVDEMNLLRQGLSEESCRLEQILPADNYRVMNYGPGGYLVEHADPGLGSLLSYLG